MSKNIFESDPGVNNQFTNYMDTDNNIDTGKYTNSVLDALNSINLTEVKAASNEIKKIINNNGHIIIAGNGGSLAISHHSACDLGKGLFRFYGSKLKVRSLGTNAALSSALANDFDYENIFMSEYEMVKSGFRDVVICISSSGNSENIIRLVKSAQNDDSLVIGLSGFEGGRLKALADVSMHVDVNNYPMVELVHQHILDLILLELWVS